MGIEFGYARLSPASPTCAFQFSSAVTAATAGITAFELAFGNWKILEIVDYLLKAEIGIVVTRSGSTVSVDMNGAFNFIGDSFEVDPDRSFVDIAAIAVISPNSGVQLPVPITLQSGGGGSFNFQPAVTELGLFISGVSFAAPNDESIYVSQITAVTGSTNASSFSSFTPAAKLTVNTDGVDHSGSIAVGAVGLMSNTGIYGMVMLSNCTFSGEKADRQDADTGGSPYWGPRPWWRPYDGTDYAPPEIATTFEREFDLSTLYDTTRYELVGAIPLLQSFSVQYPGNESRALTGIRVGALRRLGGPKDLFVRDSSEFVGAPACTLGQAIRSNQAVNVSASGQVRLHAAAVMWRTIAGFNRFHNSTNNSVSFLLVGLVRAKSSTASVS
jgi:hypothetical protein